MEYQKPWLTLEQQIERLADRGVDVGDQANATTLLRAVGYYRLTGYLYPFRRSVQRFDGTRTRPCVVSGYRAGTTLAQASAIIDFDRCLRMLVMDGVERIEVAVRMQVAYVLGRTSAFAHEDPDCFTDSFTAAPTQTLTREPILSHHQTWLLRVQERRQKSDEPCVVHFRDKYDDRMPIWALTEILEMGHLSRLYQGLNQRDAAEIATAFGVPTKRILASWLASLNYARNVAAHHARLFNRKLQHAPARPKAGQVPVLDHLRAQDSAKAVFGAYNALAVIAYLVPSISPEAQWGQRFAELLRTFPASHTVTTRSMGVPDGWESLELWRP